MVIEGGLPLCLRKMYWLSRTYGSLSLRFFGACSGAASSGALRLVEDGRGASRRRGAWAGRATWAVAMVKYVEKLNSMRTQSRGGLAIGWWRPHIAG